MILQHLESSANIAKDIEVGWATCYVGGILGDTLFRPPHFTDEVSTTIPSQSMVLIEAKRFLSIVIFMVFYTSFRFLFCFLSFFFYFTSFVR